MWAGFLGRRLAGGDPQSMASSWAGPSCQAQGNIWGLGLQAGRNRWRERTTKAPEAGGMSWGRGVLCGTRASFKRKEGTEKRGETQQTLQAGCALPWGHNLHTCPSCLPAHHRLI